MTVRRAAFQDIPRIVEIMQDAHRRSVYSETTTFDVTESKRLLAESIQRHGHDNVGGTLVMVSEYQGDVRGFCVGILDHVYPGLRELMATDLLFIMGPKAPLDAVRMLRRLMKWAKDNPKVVEVHLGVTDALVDWKRSARLYRRLGLKECGAMLCKRFERGGEA